LNLANTVKNKEYYISTRIHGINIDVENPELTCRVTTAFGFFSTA